MRDRVARTVLVLVVLLGLSLPALSTPTDAWGNGFSASPRHPAYGIHDLAADIALRDLQISNYGSIYWSSNWYLLDGSDWGPSFNASSTKATKDDNFLAWTDDPDSAIRDWDNHTLYLHPRSTWQPAKGDAERRVWDLYNLTRDELLTWMLNGSVPDEYEHRAAYHAGLMSHYMLDITQFGHTDWTLLDHSHPAYDPDDATYHAYYESQVWSDAALDLLNLELVKLPMPVPQRVGEPGLLVRELASFVNARDGLNATFMDGSTQVTLGSTYASMLANFTSNWDAGVAFKGIRGYDERLWNLTVEDLRAGIENLTSLWYSAYLDAHDLFDAIAPDIVVGPVEVHPPSGAVAGDLVRFNVTVSNRGNSSTGDFDIWYYLSGYSYEQLSLAPGEVVNRTFYWTATAGKHHLTVEADPMWDVVETNKSNNDWRTTYEVAPELYASTLVPDPSGLVLPQESTGEFNITLHNAGTRVDLFKVVLSVPPGSVDFSITIHADELLLGPGENATFKAFIAIPLNATPGRTDFTVMAVGGCSTAEAVCTVVVEEAQLPPFIELAYGKFANVSVPHRFDASRSWDHNGDPINFTWDFGDGAVGYGTVVEHAYSAVGVFNGTLDASDGALHRRFIFEVSVIDAIPPRPVLRVVEIDVDAAIVGWAPWRSEHYFAEYRLYASPEPDPDSLFAPGNRQFRSVDWRNDIATVRLPWNSTGYVGLEVVNALGLVVRSAVLPVTTHLRVPGAPGPDMSTWVTFSDIKQHDYNISWPAWEPIPSDGGHRFYRIQAYLLSTGLYGHQYWKETPIADVELDQTGYHLQLFGGRSSSPTVKIVVQYCRGVSDGTLSVPASGVVVLLPNRPPTVQAALSMTVRAGDDLTLDYLVNDPDGPLANVTVDWGDGSAPIELHGVLGNLTTGHNYAKEGIYRINITADDEDGAGANATVAVKVLAPEEQGNPLATLCLVGALAAGLVLLVFGSYNRYTHAMRGKRPPRPSAGEPLGPPGVSEAPKG